MKAVVKLMVTCLSAKLDLLRVIEFKLAVLTYHCLHSMAPPYLAEEFHRVADIDSQQQLRSASTSMLVVPLMCHPTIGDRAFPVAASRIWNSLPSSVTSSTLLTVFRQRLKTELFLQCFGPDCVWRFSSLFYVWLRTRPVCCKVSLQSLGFYDTLIIFVHNNNNNNNKCLCIFGLYGAIQMLLLSLLLLL